MKEVQAAGIDNPLEEAAYWIRKQSVQVQQNGLREMTIFVDEKTFDEFVETVDKALELGIVKEGYTQEVGKRLASLIDMHINTQKSGYHICYSFILN